MAALTTREIGYTGAITLTASTTSDTAEVGDGRNFLFMRNLNVGARTVTITVGAGGTPYTEQTNATVQYTLAASGATAGILMIPLHPDYAGSDGRCTVALDTATDVSVAVVRPRAGA